MCYNLYVRNCKPSVMPCILICSVFFLLSLTTSPVWFWHSKLKGLIRLRFSHIVEVLGLDFQTRALASSCLSLWFYHSPPQRMLFSGLPHRIYISKIKWVAQCSLLIQLSQQGCSPERELHIFLLFQSNGILWNTQGPEKQPTCSRTLLLTKEKYVGEVQLTQGYMRNCYPPGKDT